MIKNGLRMLLALVFMSFSLVGIQANEKSTPSEVAKDDCNPKVTSDQISDAQVGEVKSKDQGPAGAKSQGVDTKTGP